MLLSDDERDMLEAISDNRGLTASDMLRTLIREEYAAKLTEPGETPEQSLAVVKPRLPKKNLK